MPLSTYHSYKILFCVLDHVQHEELNMETLKLKLAHKLYQPGGVKSPLTPFPFLFFFTVSEK